MKNFIILILLFVNLFATEKQKITIGAGPYIQIQPYQDVDNILLPSPVIFLIMVYFILDGHAEVSIF